MLYRIIDGRNEGKSYTFDELLDFFEPGEDEESHYEWEDVRNLYDLRTFIERHKNGTKVEEEPENIDILMLAGSTKTEAEKHLEAGATVYTDFEENFDLYMDELDATEEEKEEYKQMIENKKPVQDWAVVEYDGKTYYIQYCL